MLLSKELVKRFQQLYQEKYGEEIDFGNAEVELRTIAELVRLTASSKEVKQNAQPTHC